MSLSTRRKKRSSSTNSPRKRTPKKQPPKKRVAKRCDCCAAKHRKPYRKIAKGCKICKRAHAKSKISGKRSSAAKKGWATRRKRKRLIEAMADLRMKRAADAQPLGWLERRDMLRQMDDGTLWRRIIVTYDPKIVDAARLETLKDLEVDLLGKDDLYDYLIWVGAEAGVDISDMYRMYLGYAVSEEAAQ